MKLITELTEDGSHTIFVPLLNERYHSYHGALQESMHIFIKNGFLYSIQNKLSLNILEIGFGTGLNAILTYYSAEEHHVITRYTAIEPFPLNKKIYHSLNYRGLINKTDAEHIFGIIHDSDWGKDIIMSDQFILHKIKNGIEGISLSQNHFDLVYFDAFAPQVQPELWEKSIFYQIFNSVNYGGCLITYCAKGSVKRDLAAAGFIVESLEGPPGKREITRAIKSE